MTDTTPITAVELQWFRTFNANGYDPQCQWCRPKQPRPCVGCQAKRNALEPKADAEYRRQFPNGPKPIASFPRTHKGIKQARQFIEGAIKQIAGEQT